jgi:uncharacterized membrane protein YagU involved in acid resistance
MTGVIVVSRWLGLFRTPPPAQIAQTAAREVGVAAIADDAAFGPLWLGLHLAFGAGCGVLYRVLLPRCPVFPLAGGASYGLLLWAVNYLGLMPALGLFPPPRQAGQRRTVVMIVAHLVYGLALAHVSLNRRLHG